MGVQDPGAFLLVRLRHSIDGVTLHLDRPTNGSPESAHLRADAISELRRGLVVLRRTRTVRPGRAIRGSV
jgi:hypothetical protein